MAGLGVQQQDMGLTKREQFAINADTSGIEFKNLDDLAEFIGREIDPNDCLDMIKANAECAAKVKVIMADALLAELERARGE